jgi:membrane protein YqaA with SNARE-associated domain
MSDDSIGRGREFSGVGLNAVAALWGFAEATLFFIVPDVLLSWIALTCLRRALWACCWALGGALLGGLIMYSWGATRLESAEAALALQPAVDQQMLHEVREQIEQSGLKALFAGPLEGRPYKIYAVYAGALRVNLPGFLLISIPARLLRFVVISCLTAFLAQKVLTFTSLRAQRIALCVCWVTFYAWFFGQV